MNTTVQPSKTRVLGTAFCCGVLVPPLLILSLGRFLNSATDHSRRVALFFIFCASAAAQAITLFTLNRSSGWTFGLAKFASYLLKIAAFMLLLIFTIWAIIAGYYLLNANAPPIFS